MGLSTSHGCFQGSYSGFMAWRIVLNMLIMKNRASAGDSEALQIYLMRDNCELAIHKAWDDGHYDDQSIPINVLMKHSDCDGDIKPEVCGPLADYLQNEIVDRWFVQLDRDSHYRQKTEKFIAGLRLAAKRNEIVEFF